MAIKDVLGLMLQFGQFTVAIVVGIFAILGAVVIPLLIVILNKKK